MNRFPVPPHVTPPPPPEPPLQPCPAVWALADEYLAGNPDLSIGQARADAFLDLLLRRAHVQTVVTINITDATLTHLAGPAPTTATTTTTAGSTTTAATAKAASDSRAVPLPEPAFPYLPADQHPPPTPSLIPIQRRRPPTSCRSRGSAQH
mgnify:CR=1 FL=1